MEADVIDREGGVLRGHSYLEKSRDLNHQGIQQTRRAGGLLAVYPTFEWVVKIILGQTLTLADRP